MFRALKSISKQKKIFLSSLFAFLALQLYAESFRVGKIHIIHLDLDSSINSSNINPDFEETKTVGINEGLAIYLPEDKTFIEGIEIKMDIPEDVASWMDSVACSVYDKINPLPSPSQIDYSATRQYVSCLPGRLSWVLQIPIKKENSIKTNRYTTKIDTVPEFQNNVILLRLQPVMKGIPEETLNSKIPMTVKPVLSDKGQLKLNIINAENTDFPSTVFINDKIVNYSKDNNKILLDKGIHTVSIISDSYRNEVRTVRVDQAKTTELTVMMKSTEPTLVINSPEAAIIEFDGNPWDKIGTEVIISEGEHKIKFTIGDYEILKTIQAIQGKTYTVNFSIDLDVVEE